MAKLSKGFVSQNGSWISYKTKSYSNQIDFFTELANELKEFIESIDGTYYGSFEARHADDSISRKYCLTIMVTGKCPDSVPYEPDAIN